MIGSMPFKAKNKSTNNIVSCIRWTGANKVQIKSFLAGESTGVHKYKCSNKLYMNGALVPAFSYIVYENGIFKPFVAQLFGVNYEVIENE